ncbi:MAG: hypothetical protein P1U57_01150, partial [Oleibacter sp.]|nr:hypothetical protein [Thalassolituus sp.]
HLRDTRYTNNDIYLDQIAMADVLVANKNDLATEQDRQAFDALVARSQPAKALVLRTEQGKIDWRLIAELVVEDDKATERSVEHADQHSHDDGHAHHHHAHTPNKTEQAPLSLAEGEERRRFSNQGFEHFTVGWLIAGEILFSLDALRHWFDQLENADDTVVGSPLVERAKGIINTDQGWFVVNWREGVLSEMPTRVLADSRLEIITSSEPNAEDLEQSLWRCRLNPT